MSIIVTGAAKGIGRAVALEAARAGSALVLVDLDEQMLAETLEDIHATGAKAVSLVGSVASDDIAREAVQLSLSWKDGLHGLSHNAGIQRYGTAEDTDDATWNEVIEVNLTSAFRLARAALPELKKTRGSIVFMSSVQGLASQNNVAAYTASKHALNGLTKSIAMDFARHGVRANAVAPGSVDTPMLEWAISLSEDPEGLRQAIRDMHPLGRAAEAQEIAQAVMFLLSDKASFITGEILKVDGGLLTLIGGAPRSKEPASGAAP